MLSLSVNETSPLPPIPSKILFSDPQQLTSHETEGALRDLCSQGPQGTKHSNTFITQHPPEMTETPFVNGPAQRCS